MRSELLNILIFVSAIAKFLLMTGLGMGGVIALLAECCGFRVVAFGFERVRAEQLANALNNDPAPTRLDWATSSARKFERCA